MLKLKYCNTKALHILLITLAVFCVSFIIFIPSVSASVISSNNVNEEVIEFEPFYIDGTGLTEKEIQEQVEAKVQEQLKTKVGIQNVNNNDFSIQATPTLLTAGIVRISGDIHQLYLNYKGTATINSFRLRNVRISNTNLLIPRTYHNESYVFKSTTGLASGSQYLFTFTAPSTATKLRVSVGSLEAYYHSSGWRSGLIDNGEVTVR
ncbi:hypothetical protein ADIAL_0426 [Alkalibacterium sp. AK22]|uniref:hypothetical protein n=1 Tax=Alkalibacterium sp. AK22 TaxID=1229520 RepID=UPI0004523789|nr:hypothetical protein [Alkalibacterium sp. AK22]EXJ24091.1 hypothetical protein ADIAL_0426 [Alkalibacterium sp. AK22]